MQKYWVLDKWRQLEELEWRQLEVLDKWQAQVNQEEMEWIAPVENWRS